jgi:hypothetical protein
VVGLDSPEATMPDKQALSLVQEAEQARQVVNVLTRIEERFLDGRWDRGYRFSPSGGNCLIGAIDEATSWVLPGVAERVTLELASRLPAKFQVVARVRPRAALALYNDTVGGREGALELVRETRYALGGLPLIRVEGAQRRQPWSSARPSGGEDHVIDLTDTPVGQPWVMER